MFLTAANILCRDGNFSLKKNCISQITIFYNIAIHFPFCIVFHVAFAISSFPRILSFSCQPYTIQLQKPLHVPHHQEHWHRIRQIMYEHKQVFKKCRWLSLPTLHHRRTWFNHTFKINIWLHTTPPPKKKEHTKNKLTYTTNTAYHKTRTHGDEINHQDEKLFCNFYYKVLVYACAHTCMFVCKRGYISVVHTPLQTAFIISRALNPVPSHMGHSTALLAMAPLPKFRYYFIKSQAKK